MENLPAIEDEEYHSSGLSSKQEQFCFLVSQGLNATEAYRQAKYKVKTDGAAKSAASRLLTNVNVKAFIKYLRQKAIDATIADLVEVKQGLTEIIRTRPSQFVKLSNGNALIEPDEKAMDSAGVAEITTETVRIGGRDSPLSADITKLKLRDPIPAARLLAELSGWTAKESAPPVQIANFVFVMPDGSRYTPKELANARG
ncbi:MAG: terminase small subunit [Dehalococcoidales bacterium]|nr:terminase small subunit [Dehalococcoidales bacterium]